MKQFAAICAAATVLLSSHVFAEEEKWSEYKTRHFTIFYKSASIEFVKTVGESAEEYYKEITRNLGFTRYENWTYDDRAQIYIFDDKKDYVDVGGNLHWSVGNASPSQKIIRTFPSASGFFDTTLPHELGHIIFREFVGPKARFPGWFNEGVAMYQEKARRYGSHSRVSDAMNQGKFIPLQDLNHVSLSRNSSQETVDIFYLESASVVSFLIGEYGRTRFVRLCEELEEGKNFEQALQNIYVRFRSIEDLNDAWVKFLKN